MIGLSILLKNLYTYYKFIFLTEVFFGFQLYFFRFSDFKFSTQFVSTLIVAGIILFQVSWPHYR